MLTIFFLCLSAVFAADISFDCSCLGSSSSHQFYVSWRNFDQLGVTWVDPIIALHYVPTSYIGTPSVQYLNSRIAASMHISTYTGSQTTTIATHFSSWPYVQGTANTLYCSLTTLSGGVRIQRGPLTPAGTTCSLSQNIMPVSSYYSQPTPTPAPRPYPSYYYPSPPTSYPTAAPTYAPSSYYSNPTAPPTSPSYYYPSPPTSYPTAAPTYAPYYYPSSPPTSYYSNPTAQPTSYYPAPVYIPSYYPPTYEPQSTLGAILGPIIGVTVLMLLFALIFVWQRRKAAAEELANNNGGGFDGVTTTTVQFDPASDGGQVQVFPQHPMMQTSFSMQDPLSTLAPVYTATYVTPGVQ